MLKGNPQYKNLMHEKFEKKKKNIVPHVYTSIDVHRLLFLARYYRTQINPSRYVDSALPSLLILLRI